MGVFNRSQYTRAHTVRILSYIYIYLYISIYIYIYRVGRFRFMLPQWVLVKLRIRPGGWLRPFLPRSRSRNGPSRPWPANCCFKLINFVFISNSSGRDAATAATRTIKRLLFFNFMFLFVIICALFANLRRSFDSSKAIFAPLIII